MRVGANYRDAADILPKRKHPADVPEQNDGFAGRDARELTVSFAIVHFVRYRRERNTSRRIEHSQPHSRRKEAPETNIDVFLAQQALLDRRRYVLIGTAAIQIAAGLNGHRGGFLP